ncbi:MAG: flagellar basal body rod protein FlgB [Planctomycetota bacterium]|jgi:flagellar basal-body rod protein FlgB
MISGLTDADSMPVLERMLQFASGRQRILADNVANFDTPGYRARDVSVRGFQEALGEAVLERREKHSARGGELAFAGSDDVSVRGDRLELQPTERGGGAMSHDGNDRDLERSMQMLAENVMAVRTVTTLLRSRIDLMSAAIRERP